MKLEQLYPLTDEELSKKDELVARGWIYLPNERFKLIAPSGAKFIWLDSALEYQAEYDTIVNDGVAFKIIQDRFRFGWAIMFRTAQYKTYKMYRLFKNKQLAENIVATLKTNSKEEKINYFNIFDLNMWEDDIDIQHIKTVEFRGKYWDETSFVVSNYTDMVNLAFI